MSKPRSLSLALATASPGGAAPVWCQDHSSQGPLCCRPPGSPTVAEAGEGGREGGLCSLLCSLKKQEGGPWCRKAETDSPCPSLRVMHSQISLQLDCGVFGTTGHSVWVTRGISSGTVPRGLQFPLLPSRDSVGAGLEVREPLSVWNRNLVFRN